MIIILFWFERFFLSTFYSILFDFYTFQENVPHLCHLAIQYNVTMEQWDTGHYFPQFCSGPCNGISREAAIKIYETAQKTNTCGFRLEDVLFMGIIREKAHLEVPHFEKVDRRFFV